MGDARDALPARTAWSGNWRLCRPRRWCTRPPATSSPTSSFSPAQGPRPVFVLTRGDVNRPGEPADAGALACVPGLDATVQHDRPRRRSRPPRGAGELAGGPAERPRPGGRSSTACGTTTSAAASSPRPATSATWAPAVPPRVARLAGRVVLGPRRLAQIAAPPDRHQQHLPPVVGPQRPLRRGRRRQPPAVADEPPAARRRVRARRGPRRHRPARRPRAARPSSSSWRSRAST